MKDIAKAVMADVNAALVPIAAKHGLDTLKVVNGSAGASNFTLKVEGVKAGGMTQDQNRYAMHINLHKLPPRGYEFSSGRHRFRTHSMTRGGSVVGERIPDGKLFRFPLETIQLVERNRVLEAEAAAAKPAPKTRAKK